MALMKLPNQKTYSLLRNWHWILSLFSSNPFILLCSPYWSLFTVLSY